MISIVINFINNPTDVRKKADCPLLSIWYDNMVWIGDADKNGNAASDFCAVCTYFL